MTIRAKLIAAGVLGSVACAAGSRIEPPVSSGVESAPAPAARPESWGAALVPSLLPFPVTDSAGRRLELAFHGGLNVPRPQLVDVNGDSALDLFVQEHTGRVALFERAGSEGGVPRFVPRSDRYQDLEVGEWYRFADVDLDGDLDLLAEQPFSHIRYYRNDGGRGAPRYVLAADTLRDEEGAAIFADRQNIPQLGDLDCNGFADLLIGQLDGTIVRYEAVSRGAETPRFALVTREFEGIRIIGQGAVREEDRPTRHGANTMALGDPDGDGDLDLFWGDFFEPGLLLIANRGTCRSFDFRGAPAQFPLGDPVLTSGYNAPTVGDVSGDGRVDLVMGVLGGAYNPIRTSAENLYYIERGPAGDWRTVTRQLLPMIDVGSESVPAIVDIDGDGDQDLLLANKIDPSDQQTSRIYRFENIGSRGAPALRLRGSLPIGGRFHLAPAFGDLDGDGALDLIMGQWGMSLAWYRGSPQGFALVDSAIVTITRGSNTTPALGDLDGDGDLDLVIGEASGSVNYYRNDGGRTTPRFILVSDEWEGIRIARRSAPALADVDRDGDLDLLVGGEERGVALLRNIGTRVAPRFERDTTFAPASPLLATPAVGDLDGDGVLELVIGGAGGGAVFLGSSRVSGTPERQRQRH